MGNDKKKAASAAHNGMYYCHLCRPPRGFTLKGLYAHRRDSHGITEEQSK
jgi:hypothetical protein